MTDAKVPSRLARLALLPAFAIMALVALFAGARSLREQGAPWALILALPLLLPAAAFVMRPAARRLALAPKRKVLAGIFVASAALRALLVLTVPNRPVSDFAAYHELAQALVAGQGYALTGPAGLDDIRLYIGGSTALPRPTAFRAPGAAFWGFLLGGSEALFRVANVLLGAGTCALIYMIVAEVDAAAALWAAALWAAYPSAIFAAALYGSESLFAFFLALLGWLLSRLARGRAKAGELAAIGLCAGWLCLIRPPWLTTLAALGGVFLWSKPRKEGLRRLAVSAAFMAAAILPWSARNYRMFHKSIAISTSQGVWFGLHTSFHLPVEESSDPAWQDFAAQWNAADEPGRAAVGYRMGVFQLKKTFGAGPALVLRSIGDSLGAAYDSDTDMITWAATSRFSLTNAGLPIRESVLSPAALRHWLLLNHSYYVGLLLLAVWGVFQTGSLRLFESGAVRMVSLYFLTLFGIYCIIPAELPRYHFGMMLLAAIFAGLGANSIESAKVKRL